MSTFELAQINVARFIRAKDDPANEPFMTALDRVNALAEAAPGFVWRLKDDSNNATGVEAVPGDARFIVNMSVWRDVTALAAFAYRQSEHVAVMRRRHEWFEPMEPVLALWWVPAGHRPTVEEGMAKLATLAANGPTQEAFTFRAPFVAPTA